MTDAGTVARRALFIILALIIVLPIAGIVTVLIAFSIATRSPDLAKVAHSAEVTNADRAGTALLDDRLDAVVRAAPAPSLLATSIEDRCESGSAFFGQRPSVRCSRSVVRYLGINGAFAVRQQSWDRALKAAGWRSDDAGPTAVPTAPPVTVYYRSAAPDLIQVRLEWTERPRTPDAYRDFDRGSHPPAYAREGYLADQPVDKIAVYQQAYAHNRYVVAVGTVTYYFPTAERPVPTSPPAPSGSSDQRNCFGGHGDCPGG